MNQPCGEVEQSVPIAHHYQPIGEGVSFYQQGNITKPTILHWRDRISVKVRQGVDAVSRWLRPVDWQLFATLTFPWNVRAETADKKLRQLVNLLEKTYRARVCQES